MRGRAGAIAAGSLLLAAIGALSLWLLRGDDASELPVTPDITVAPTTTATAALPTSTPTISIGEIGRCPEESVTWRHEVVDAGAAREVQLFATSTAAPCRLTAVARLTVHVSSSEPLEVTTNGLRLAIDSLLPTQLLVAGAIWDNWCLDDEPLLFIGFGAAVLGGPIENPPGCSAASQPVRLSPLAVQHQIPPATPTPLPAGLTRVASLPETITVAVYTDARPDSTSCIEIVADIVPVSAAGKVPAKPYSCGGDFSRIGFAVDSSGLHYVLGVELLLVGKVTLPQPHFGDGTCGSIREHLLDAAEDPESAAYILVCQVQPAPRGAPASSQRGVIWARIPDGSGPPTSAPETRCWELSRYLGPPRERQSHPIQCLLE